MKNKPTCKTGLKKNIIKKDVFDMELGLCKMLNKKNKGCCAWGKCAKCGVVPLLYKLHKGKLIDKTTELAKLRKRFLSRLNE